MSKTHGLPAGEAVQCIPASACSKQRTKARSATEPGRPTGSKALMGTAMGGSSASTSTRARSAEAAVQLSTMATSLQASTRQLFPHCSDFTALHPWAGLLRE